MRNQSYIPSPTVVYHRAYQHKIAQVIDIGGKHYVQSYTVSATGSTVLDDSQDHGNSVDAFQRAVNAADQIIQDCRQVFAQANADLMCERRRRNNLDLSVVATKFMIQPNGRFVQGKNHQFHGTETATICELIDRGVHENTAKNVVYEIAKNGGTQYIDIEGASITVRAV